MPEPFPFYVAIALMAVLVIGFAWSTLGRIRRRGGLAGVLVGADIERTLVAVTATSPGMSSGEYRVHRFADATPDRVVGVELTLRTVASCNGMTAGLSAGQARELARLLRRAIGEDAPRAGPSRPARDGPI